MSLALILIVFDYRMQGLGKEVQRKIKGEKRREERR